MHERTLAGLAAHAPTHAITVELLRHLDHDRLDDPRTWGTTIAPPGTPEVLADLLAAGRPDVAVAVASRTQDPDWSRHAARRGPTGAIRMAAITSANVPRRDLAYLATDPDVHLAAAARQALLEDLDLRPYRHMHRAATAAADALSSTDPATVHAILEDFAATEEPRTTARLAAAAWPGPATGPARRLLIELACTVTDPTPAGDLVQVLARGTTLRHVHRELGTAGIFARRAHAAMWATGQRRPSAVNRADLLELESIVADVRRRCRDLYFLRPATAYELAGLAHPLLPRLLRADVVRIAARHPGSPWFHMTCENPTLTVRQRLALVRVADPEDLHRAAGWPPPGPATPDTPEVIARLALQRAEGHPHALVSLVSMLRLPARSYAHVPESVILDAFSRSYHPLPSDWLAGYLTTRLGTRPAAWDTWASLHREWDGTIADLTHAVTALT